MKNKLTLKAFSWACFIGGVVSGLIALLKYATELFDVNYWASGWATLGVTLILTGLFALVYKNAVTTSCGIVTTAISIGISAFGTLGLTCFIMRSVMLDPSKHPIEYPFSIICGLFCLVSVIALIVFYVIFRKKRWSFKGLLIDLFTTVAYTPAFFLIVVAFYLLLNTNEWYY